MNENIIKNHCESLFELMKIYLQQRENKHQIYLIFHLRRGKYRFEGILNTKDSIECKIMKNCLVFWSFKLKHSMYKNCMMNFGTIFNLFH
jgi:hypothetical protein